MWPLAASWDILDEAFLGLQSRSHFALLHVLSREVQCGDVVTALDDVVPVEGESAAQYAASFL